MSLVTVALAVLLGAEPEASQLVAKLGTASASELVAITARLEALGLPALGPLRVAARGDDPELRRCAAAALEKIESGLLVRPTLVTLGFQNRTISEVAATVSAQTGIALALEPPADLALRLSVEDARPLPFWEALDRITNTARLHHNPAFPRGSDERTPVFHLEEGARPFPQSVSGPFRVGIVSIRRRHAIVFESTGDDDLDEEEADPERFEVVIQVFAEPRIIVTLNGPPKELKARDDFDQDLVPPAPAPEDDADDAPDPAPRAQVESGPGPVPGTLSIVQFPIALHAPDQPGTTVQRLEGFVPLQVAIRRPDPLVVRVADGSGESHEAEDLSLRVTKRPPPSRARGTLELLVRIKTRADALTPDDAAAPPDFPEPRPVDTLQNRLEILDAQGRPLAFRVINVQTDDSGESNVVIGLSGRDAGATPVALRIYSLIVGAVEVPFKFAKLPIP